jgi:putative ABC transport system substrate-binding protein
LTGFVEINTELAAKRLGLLHELVPRITRVALLIDPSVSPDLSRAVATLQAAALPLGVQIDAIMAPGTRERIDAAFAGFSQKGIESLLLSPSAFYQRFRMQIAALAAYYALPAIYWDRSFVESGGLMSYGSSVTNMFRQVGIYAGRILKGEKPVNMPVQQATNPTSPIGGVRRP